MREGDFFLLKYGFGIKEFYILDVTKKHVIASRESWCVSGAIAISISEVEIEGDFVCHGKKKWWWKFLPFINDLICPYYKQKSKNPCLQ